MAVRVGPCTVSLRRKNVHGALANVHEWSPSFLPPSFVEQVARRFVEFVEFEYYCAHAAEICWFEIYSNCKIQTRHIDTHSAMKSRSLRLAPINSHGSSSKEGLSKLMYMYNHEKVWWIQWKGGACTSHECTSYHLCGLMTSSLFCVLCHCVLFFSMPQLKQHLITSQSLIGFTSMWR